MSIETERQSERQAEHRLGPQPVHQAAQPVDEAIPARVANPVQVHCLDHHITIVAKDGSWRVSHISRHNDGTLLPEEHANLSSALAHAGARLDEANALILDPPKPSTPPPEKIVASPHRLY